LIANDGVSNELSKMGCAKGLGDVIKVDIKVLVKKEKLDK
jgi:hypothetical protein